MPAKPTTPHPVPPRVHLTLVAVQLMFAGFHVVGKLVLGEVDPLSLATLRVVGATPVLLLFAWWWDRVLPSWRDLPHLALLGFLGVFANQLLFILGLERTTATNAAILMPSIPVFAAAVGALAGIERPGWRRLTGILLAVGGALVMLRPTRFSLTDGTTVGNGLILVNTLSYACFLVAQRPLLERLPWRTVIAWSFLFGGLGVGLVGGPTLAAEPVGSWSPPLLLGIAYIVVFPTILGYALNTWAVKRSTPTLVAAYTTLQPLASATLAATFLAETVGWHELAGFVLIMGGLFLVSRGARRS